MSSSTRTLGLLGLRVVPVAHVSPRAALKIVERNVQVYRKSWLLLLTGFAEPFFYLLSLGVGLSHLVGGISVGGRVVTYTLFAAPGLLASAAMNGAIFDTTFNLFYKLKVAKTYEAVLATPLGTAEVALGEIGWALCRATLYSAGFLAVMAGLGLVDSYWALLCLLGAPLVSLAFAATGTAVTSYLHTWQDLDTVALGLLPLFLFSCTFYPITVYPGAVQAIVRLSPLYQGVAMLRAFDLGTVGPDVVLHAGYLGGMAVAGTLITARRLRKVLAS